MRIQACMVWVLLLIGLGACQPDSKEVQIRVQDGMVYLDKWTPLDDSDNDNVKLYVWDEEQQAPNELAVAGKIVTTRSGALAFAPLFPLDQRTSYLLSIDSDSFSFQYIIEGASEPRMPPVVTHFYPSRDSLPENLLRMYIQFSQPMKTTGNLERIKIIDEEGNKVSHAIFNNVYELWNDDQTQLTLLFDPARVKTGLNANERYGRALRAGHSYIMVVEDLEDVHGEVLDGKFQKTIHAIEEDREAPDMDRWSLDIPEAQSLAPLIVQFPDMIDHLSLLTRLSLIKGDKTLVQGNVTLNEYETAWIFTPQNPWVQGTYVLQANARLEDPAGNNLNGLFDHKAGSLLYEKEGERISLKFTIAG